jgi:hypothetical protein
MSWVIKHDVPYEGINEDYYETAAEVIEYLEQCSHRELENITIEPEATESYYPYEFVAAFQQGKVV